MENESKEARFRRVAERRVRAILQDLRILGNCGNRGNYSYTESDYRKIFSEIDQALKDAKVKFHLPKEKKFEL
ncbi:MAG: hypothetical protein Q8Q22_01645 [bacterium]|nr:hypothetical protein [bacterium]